MREMEDEKPAKKGLLARESAPSENEAQPDESATEAKDAPIESDGEMSNVTPEEQRSYDRFVDNCFSVVYDQKTLPQILKALDASDDVKMNLANAAVLVVKFVADSARKAGQEISVDVLMHGGKEIIEDLADLAGKVGLHTYTPDELEGAVYIAMDLYRNMAEQDGTLDVEGSKRDMAMALRADQAGTMDDIIPGASARFGAKKPTASDEPTTEEDDEEAA